MCMHTVYMCASNEKRERGNELYGRGEFSRAVDVYTKYVYWFLCLLQSSGISHFMGL